MVCGTVAVVVGVVVSMLAMVAQGLPATHCRVRARARALSSSIVFDLVSSLHHQLLPADDFDDRQHTECVDQSDRAEMYMWMSPMI